MRFGVANFRLFRVWAGTLLTLASAMACAAQPNIAVFYGANPPWDELRAFDVVVVEPEQVPDPRAHANSRTALFAYVSVGEADSRSPVPEGHPGVMEIRPKLRLGQCSARSSSA